jgi:hypothetical protein
MEIEQLGLLQKAHNFITLPEEEIRKLNRLIELFHFSYL